MKLQADFNSEETVDAVFEPLGWHEEDIRLATLHPAESEFDLIVCTLERVSLDDNPKYEALSWAWGDASLTETILLQGEFWQTPQNLTSALRSIRDVQQPRRLWIDAICINQSRVDSALHERSHQVSLMKAIYANAELVIIWLGESMEWTPEFFNDLRLLAEPDYKVKDACCLISSHGREAQTNNWVFVRWLWDFIYRPWWRRVWVLQEFLLPREAVVACGSCRISFDQVVRAFTVIRQASNELKGNSRVDSQRFISWGGYISMVRNVYRYGLGTKAGTHTDNHHVLQLSRQKSQLSEEETFVNFSKLLAACRFQLSTDPRDMIYGILGLSADVVSKQMTARYDMSVRDVYMQTTLKLIHKTKTLFVLSQAQIATWRPQKLGATASLPSTPWIPSWVPDWSLKRREFGYSSEMRCGPRVERECLFNASSDTKAKIHLINEHVLGLRGIRVDEVSSLHKLWSAVSDERLPNIGFLDSWRRRTNQVDGETSQLNGSCANIDLAQEAYIGGGSKAEAFWKSWVHDVHPVDEVVEDLRRCDDTYVHLCEDWRSANLASAFIGSGESFPFQSLLSSTSLINLRLILTKDGFIGLGNAMIDPGDLIYILAGGTHPFVLRKCGTKPKHYRIVGEVYVHGLMDGEVLTRDYGSSIKRHRRQEWNDMNRDKRKRHVQDEANEAWEALFLE